MSSAEHNLTKRAYVPVPANQEQHTPLFEYHPLMGSRQFRYLVLQPTKNGKIACDLHHASIDDNLPFEALSYCWGKSEILHDISLKGKRFSVTENLYLALYQLRLSYEVRNLWIDALCIDQKHDNEKTHQVELMSSIFQHASQVLVWLRPTADNSNIAIDFISSNKERKSPHCRLEMNDEESAALLKLASRPW